MHRDDQHTSDGNDQHSSRDARGDCAVGQRPVLGASTDATMTGQCDPQAMHASLSMSCALSRDDSHSPHDHDLHANQSACSEGVCVTAPSAAAPHLQGARLPISFDYEPNQCEDQRDLVRSTSVSNFPDPRADSRAPLIEFGDVSISQLRVGASPHSNENAMSMNPFPAQACAAQAVVQTTCSSECGSAFNSQSQSISARVSSAQYVAMQQRMRAMRADMLLLESELCNYEYQHEPQCGSARCGSAQCGSAMSGVIVPGVAVSYTHLTLPTKA